jgi:uncharacterized membrane protein
MRISRLKFVALIVMSIVGITASSMVFYIYDTLHQQLPYCVSSQTIFGVKIDCNTVLSSSYNNVFGINLDLLAITYFLVNMGLVFAVSFGGDKLFRRAFRTLFAWRFLGLIIVPYLITIEFVVLKAICVYCTVMHISILIDFVIVTYLLYWKDDVSLLGGDPSSSLDEPSEDEETVVHV